jgi:predicted PolB exonuclease-like 3'-5' exonuclease
METVLVFDIETVPDVEGGRRLHDLQGVADEDVARAMAQITFQERGREFLPHHLQKVVAISCALCSPESFRLWSLGTPDESEAGLIGRFFEGIERYSPVLVSWNGSGFDLPVLHYRALINGVVASQYWEIGENDRDFKFNSYLSRYHWRHTDVMDVLSGYQPKASAKLDQIAVLLGLPGKMGMDGSQVWDAYRAGRIAEIRNYCETDVLNTYLVYLRFQLMRGCIKPSELVAEHDRVRKSLLALDQPHLQAFLDAWPVANG